MVADPYRPLEDLNDAQVKEWVQKENELSDKYLADSKYRGSFKFSLDELYDF